MSDLDIDVTFSHQDDPAFCFEEEGENLYDEERDEDAEEDGYRDCYARTVAYCLCTYSLGLNTQVLELL